MGTINTALFSSQKCCENPMRQNTLYLGMQVGQEGRGNRKRERKIGFSESSEGF